MIGLGRTPCDEGVIRAAAPGVCPDNAKPWVLAAAILGVLMWPLLLAGLALVLYSSAIGLAWARWGRACLVSLSFREVIRYVLAKLPIYFRFIGRRQRVWIKTARDPDQSGEPLESKSSK